MGKSVAFICITLLFVSAAPAKLWSTSRQAASCQEADIRAALSGLVDGDTVIVPKGTNCSISTRIQFDHAISLIGAGSDPVNGTKFVINANIDAFYWTSTHGAQITVKGFSATAGNTTTVGSVIRFSGDGDHQTDAFLFQDLRFTHLPGRAIIIGYLTGATAPIYGLIEAINFDTDLCHPAVLYYGTNDAWFADPELGTGHTLRIEDSKFSWSSCTTMAALDVEHGGRFLFRNNTVKNGGVLFHDTGSTAQSRGTRQFEIINNTFTCTDPAQSKQCFDAISLRGGTGIVANNKIAMDPAGNNGWQRALFTEIKREAKAGGPPMDFACGASAHPACSSFRGWCSLNGTPTNTGCSFSDECQSGAVCNFTAPPTSASCGTGYTVITNIDGLGSSPTGYPCRDQTAAGKDDPVTHAQTPAANPVYVWGNTDSRNGDKLILNPVDNGNNVGYINPDREYYAQGPKFNGSSGVGVGPLSSRPSTCSKAVGWFDSGSNQLSTCNKGVWSVYWTPYSYPDPLLAGGGIGGGTLPAPPSNVQARAQ